MSEDIAAPNETTIAALSGMDQGTRDRALVMLQSYGHDIEAIKEKLTQPATPAPTPQPSLDPERAQAMRENAQRLGISSDAIDRMLDPTEMGAFSNVHLDPLTFHDLPSQDVAALEHELKVTLAQAEVEPGLASGFMRAFGEAYKNFGNIASMSDFERQQHFQAEAWPWFARMAWTLRRLSAKTQPRSLHACPKMRAKNLMLISCSIARLVSHWPRKRSAHFSLQTLEKENDHGKVRETRIGRRGLLVYAVTKAKATGH